MKKTLLLVLLITFTLISCKKDPPTEYNGTLTGYDMRECACCGGIFIEIDKSIYRFENLPPNSGIDLTVDTFPINVVVEWHKKSPQCMGDEIIIDKIRKR
jgi:hypothetical protein